MKHVLIAAGFAMSATTGVFANDDSKMPEHIGFGSGAAVGAAVAGPVGVVIGGTLGAPIGHDVVHYSRDPVSTGKSEQFWKALPRQVTRWEQGGLYTGFARHARLSVMR